MHTSVLLAEIMMELKNNFFNKSNNLDNTTFNLTHINNIFIDCTFGFGGYSFAILNTFPNAKVIAFEIDSDSLQYANKIKEQFPDRFTIINSNFANITKELLKLNITKVSAIIADLGISSMQIDSKDRGFSFTHDAKLDMRMNNKDGIDAYTVINNYDEKKLADIIYYFGEEKFAKRIAKNIINYRKLNSIETTTQLAKIISEVIPYKYSKTHPATKTFQAIRIFVNQELENLKSLLSQTSNLLIPNGMLAVVSFHSLEDKIVKDYIKANATIKIQQSKYKNRNELIIQNKTDQGINQDINIKLDENINKDINNELLMKNVNNQALINKSLNHHIIKNENITNLLLNKNSDNKLTNNNLFDIYTHKLIVPTQAEISSNNRARSAKLRIIKKK
ncbi:MAG: 16S rRNA (cytosine(1402)-N(4))-methyltransferase RsmH [Rickettsiales bacterium]